MFSRKIAACWILAAAGIPAMISHAAPALPEDTAARAASGSEWTTVSNRRLDEMRGGFDLGSGLLVSFGITRAVYINGDLVATNSFTIKDFSKLTPDQVQIVSQQASALNLVQNGSGNTFNPAAIASSPATFIQNTLDNQHIQNQTIITASANSLAMIRGMNALTTLRDALNGSLGK
jgi:hypothetical protein